MASSPLALAWTSVCTDCFEKYQKKDKAALLLKSKCLDPSNHKNSVEVRVHKTGDGILEPEIRPTPRVRFKGEFVLCTAEKCKERKGKKCTYPHCLKEKAAWNAEKYGIWSPSGGSTRVTTAVSIAGISSSTKTEFPQHQEPWPDFPGYDAINLEQASPKTPNLPSGPPISTPIIHPTTRVPVTPIVQPTPKVPVVQPTPRAPVVQPTPKVPAAQPTPRAPVIQPTPRVPIVQPTTKVPAAQPTTKVPAAQHTPRASVIQPTPRVPIVQPTTKVPAAQPTTKVPAAQHTPRAPVAQPTPKVPIAQPTRGVSVTQPSPSVHVTQSAPRAPVVQPTPKVPVPSPTPWIPVAQPTPSVPVTQPMLRISVPSLSLPEPAQKWQKGRQRASSAEVIHKPLEVSNYHLKFRELLKLEERAHAELLEKRCNGKHFLVLLQAGLKPGEWRFDAKPDHARFGYFRKMGSDEVSYATQSASAAIIKINNFAIKCDILRENNFHAEERLYVAFTKEAIAELKSFFDIRKCLFESPYPLEIEFRLKYSYFHSLKEAVRDFQKDVIARILPNPSSFAPLEALDDTRFQPFQKLCSTDQLVALKVIASAPSTGPPVLISGPFGTGKTQALAIAAHYFLQQSLKDNSALRILVCTQQHNSADAYLEMYNEFTTEEEPINIVRLIAKYTWRKRGPLHRHYKTVEEFKKVMERDSHRNSRRFLVITTCLTAKQISDILPRWFFTHIFLDEGAQMREPEAIAPLCMASKNTKIVIAGDKYQVGPAMLVLGDEPQKYGLSKSLLERMYDLYCSWGDVAKPYCANLCTNFRCHRKILDLACQVAYKMPLHCEVSDKSTHPEAMFPLKFVCTSLDPNIKVTESSINKDEVYVALKVASDFFMKWPKDVWGNRRDLSQICFLSPCRGQVTVARNTKENLPPQVKSVRKVPTYQIQGQEFRALFISTSEPTKANGETRDSTKSISDPHVFITAITRARSLVVAVGNPFMLLKREEHMVRKYGDRGYCWSLFLKACLDNKSVHCPFGWDDSKMKLLTNQVDRRISHLHLVSSEPLQSATERDGVVPSINVIPNTPTESPGITSSTEESKPTSSHLLENHTLKEKLGKGGYGVVYIAEHKYDKRECALKIVRLPDDTDEQKKVLREVEALAQLNHPNIVGYYDSWPEKAPHNWKHTAPWKYLPSSGSVSYPSPTDDSQRQASGSDIQAQALQASATTTPSTSSQSSGPLTSEGSSSFAIEFAKSDSKKGVYTLQLDPAPPFCLCIKTELCNKATLKTWLDDRTTIHNRKRKYVIDCFMEILCAVEYIHSQGLMHRDLKPSNIFFSREREGKIKIGDFGLVTTSQVAVSEAAVSQSRDVGTSFYISPEQNNKERYGKMVDVYALGIIYFEMNCPFGSDTERCKVLTALCNSRKFPPRFMDNSPHEAALIELMLSEDPQNRPSAERIASRVKTLRKDAKKKKDATIPRL